MRFTLSEVPGSGKVPPSSACFIIFVSPLVIATVFLSFEVLHVLEIAEQPGPCWAPSQPFLRLRAGCRTVHTRKVPEKAKMVGCLLGGFRDDRHLEAAPDGLGDVAKRHALFGDGVIPGSRRGLLKRLPVEAGNVEHVRGGPAVEPVADIH